MSSMEISNLTRETLRKMFAQDKRFDGRKLLDVQHATIEYGVSNMAEGSARVKMGKTEVLVGVKLSLGEPYPDSPESGNLIVSGDLLPLASPRFESGPPKFNAIELPRLLDRMIRESGMIDFKKLGSEVEGKVWTVMVDVYPINDDGSLVDAASIGCVAALRHAVIPGVTKEGNVDYKHRTKNKLPLVEGVMPVSFTFYKLGDSMLLHPTREEEEACDSKVTFGISKWNGHYMINSGQKGWEVPFSQDEINKIMDMLPHKYDEVMKKLNNQLK